MVTITIARRFSGPPDCGNGGYGAGLIAAQIGEPVAVRLHKPLPLDTELRVARVDETHWDVHAGELRVASATVASVALEAPTPAPSYEQALALSEQQRVVGNARYDECFVCGCERARGDGLRIFSGALPSGVGVAAPWSPDASLSDAAGHVRPEIVWAALDCPGYFAAFRDGSYALLGELAVQQEAPVPVDQCYVVVGFPVAREGRKRLAGTALFDGRGVRLALGIATWIEVALPIKAKDAAAP